MIEPICFTSTSAKSWQNRHFDGLDYTFRIVTPLTIGIFWGILGNSVWFIVG